MLPHILLLVLLLLLLHITPVVTFQATQWPSLATRLGLYSIYPVAYLLVFSRVSLFQN